MLSYSLKIKRFIYSLLNCGFNTDYIARKYYKILNTDIKTLVTQDVIQIKKGVVLCGKVVNIYILSQRGKEMLLKNGRNLYKSDITQLEHDYVILNFYSKLPTEYQFSWRNETELKSRYNSSTTDGIFISDGKIVAVEVLTPSYTAEFIKEKMNFIDKYCDDSIILKTSDLSKFL